MLRLSALRVLNVYGNQLINVDGVGALASTKLMELNLGGNLLESLPDEFRLLSSLQRLWLDDNRLSAFPAPLLALAGLRNLRLSGNKIEELDDGVRALDQLRSLSLDNNLLTSLPPGLCSLTQLETLSVRSNALTHLPDSLHRLSSLRCLAASSNRLRALPRDFGAQATDDCARGLEALEDVQLNGNELTTLPAAMRTLRALRRINLSNNRIALLPDELLHWLPGACEGGGGAGVAPGRPEVLLDHNPLVRSPQIPNSAQMELDSQSILESSQWASKRQRLQ